MPNLEVVSRILIATIFVVSGFSKLLNFQAITAMSASAGIPVPQVAIALAAAVEIGAGLALAVGWQTRRASLALFLFLIPATLVFHVMPMADPAQRQTQFIEALKNFAIMGGLLHFYASAARVGAVQISRQTPSAGYQHRRAS